MPVKIIVLTSGTTFTPTGDQLNANAQIICTGAGANGQAGFFSSCGCGIASNGGRGGTSGCTSTSSASFNLGTSPISIQIPAANSTAQCWFNSPATVSANSQSTSTAGMSGVTLVAGSTGGVGQGNNPCGTSAGGGGGGTPGLSTPGGAGTNGAGGTGGTGGGAGTPNNYALFGGGTAGPGTGGTGSSSPNAPGGNAGGSNTNNFGAGGGGGAANVTCSQSSAGGTGEPGGIIIVYTPTSSGVFVGTGRLSGTALLGVAAFGLYKGTGSLKAVGLLAEVGLCALAGAGKLSAFAVQQMQEFGNRFAGAGSLLANASDVRQTLTTFAGTGLLSVLFFQRKAAYLTANGNGQMLVSTTQNAIIYAAFNGTGRMCTYAQRFLGSTGATSNTMVTGPGFTENVVV